MTHNKDNLHQPQLESCYVVDLISRDSHLLVCWLLTISMISEREGERERGREGQRLPECTDRPETLELCQTDLRRKMAIARRWNPRAAVCTQWLQSPVWYSQILRESCSWTMVSYRFAIIQARPHFETSSLHARDSDVALSKSKAQKKKTKAVTTYWYFIAVPVSANGNALLVKIWIVSPEVYKLCIQICTYLYLCSAGLAITHIRGISDKKVILL